MTSHGHPLPSDNRRVASQTCPICGATVPTNQRYPRAVCAECAGRVRNAEGLPVRFSNRTLLGTGLIEQVNRVDTWVTARETIGYGPFECWIDGVACEAQEAYFGGVVIQTR